MFEKRKLFSDLTMVSVSYATLTRKTNKLTPVSHAHLRNGFCIVFSRNHHDMNKNSQKLFQSLSIDRLNPYTNFSIQKEERKKQQKQN